jgi:hypothetical protein
MRRVLAIATATLLAACSSHRVSVGGSGPRREIAVVKVIEATGARLESINGVHVSSASQIQLGPGDYTLGLRYVGEKRTDEPQEVSFHAEAGHQYELSAASADVSGGRWTPVLVDDSTQTQLYPKK